MTLTIAQESNPHSSRKGYWQWRVWLDGPASELDGVSKVEYHLHHTYKNPVRTITSRRSHFRLRSAGYGEFMLRALVKKHDGETVELNHWLKLATSAKSAPSTEAASQTVKGTIFLSYPKEDSQLAEELAKALAHEGLEVMTTNTAPPGSSVFESMEEQIQQANAAVVVLTQDRMSRWSQMELETAQANKVPIIPVLYEERPRPSHLPKSVQETPFISIKDTAYPTDAAHSIALSLAKLIEDA